MKIKDYLFYRDSYNVLDAIIFATLLALVVSVFHIAHFWSGMFFCNILYLAFLLGLKTQRVIDHLDSSNENK